MKNAHPSRAAAARARDAETQPPAIAVSPYGAEHLLQGWPLFGEPSHDLSAWCAEVLTFPGPPLPSEVHSALIEARDQPTVTTAVYLADALDAASVARSRHMLDMGRLANLAERARLSAAFLGDYRSCMTASFEAGIRALSAGEDHTIFRYTVSERLLANLAAFATTSQAPLTADRISDLRETSVAEVLTLSQVGMIFFPDPWSDVRDDTGWLADDEEEPWSPPRPRNQGLVVVRSVEHLPGSAKDGSQPSSASTPRTEWAPLAGRRLSCAPMPDLAVVRATLSIEFPHAAALVDRILAFVVGRPWVRLPAILLVGAPGSGKTRLARRLAEALGLKVTVYGCGGVSDAAFLGTSRQWGTARASVPLQAVRRFETASPAIILDEIEKAGTSRTNGNLSDGLLGMIEGAEAYFDPYLECPVDLSGVTYLATANTRAGIPAPLLDRFRVFDMPTPRAEDLVPLARALMADLRTEQGTDKSWMPDLVGDELALVEEHWKGGSVRRLRRLVETVIDSRDHLAPRH